MAFKTLLLLLALPFAAHAESACREDVGAARAQVLVDRCLEASPATHPPCNASNPCEMIRAEIVRGCAFIAAGPGTENLPSWCRDYEG